MTIRLVAAAVLLAIASLLVVAGVTRFSVGAGLIAAGLALGAWTWLILGDA